jgi:hypothetical protein
MIIKHSGGTIKEVVNPDGNKEALEKKLRQANGEDDQLEKKGGEEKPFWLKQD